MFVILLSWLGFFLIITSTGLLTLTGLSRIAHTGDARKAGLFGIFWTGLAMTIAYAQLWSLFAPLGALSLMIWILAALSGAPALVRFFIPSHHEGNRSKPITARVRTGFFISGAVLIILIGATGVATRTWMTGAYDTELYHFSAVRWMNEYAALPGLANLHSRLGLNSGFLLFSALFDNLWWDRHTAWLTQGFIVTVACIQWLAILLDKDTAQPLRRKIFCLLTYPCLIRMLVTIQPTLYYDDIALLIQLVFMAELLRFTPSYFSTHEDAGSVSRQTAPWLLMITTLGALGFSIKPTGAISLLFAVLCSSTILIWIILKYKLRLIEATRTATAIFILAAAIVLGHLSRNAVLSGWLLFPAPAGKLHVEWAMPEYPAGHTHADEMQSARGLYHILKGWARLPGEQYRLATTNGASFWIPKWRQRVWHGVEPWLLYTGFVFMLAHLSAWCIRRARKQAMAFDGILIALASANLCFWFLTAPDMRFGHGFFWIWMGLGGCMFLARPGFKLPTAPVFAGFALVYLLPWLVTSRMPERTFSLHHIGKAEPKPTTAIVLDNGQVPPLILNVPSENDLCGDAELPATPYPRKTLQLRRPGLLKYGFRVAAPEQTAASDTP
jgi:hypothetical protein